MANADFLVGGSGTRASIAIKPREARVTLTRILRQADWDWGMEPAVGAFVLAAQYGALDGLSVLDRDWEAIRTSRPDRMTALRIGPNAWQLDAAGCHAFVAAPSVLDHLVAGGRDQTMASVTVEACATPGMMQALAVFGGSYGLSISTRAEHGSAVLTAVHSPGSYLPMPPLDEIDYVVAVDLWHRLLSRSLDYLVPESEVSRGHAGDGTQSFPLTPEGRAP